MMLFDQARWPRAMRFAMLATLVWLACASLAAGRELTRDALREPLILRDGWRWQPGDDPSWARPDLDDRGWRELVATDSLREKPWISWFRREIEVDESLWGLEIGLYFDLRGAAQLFLDGELLYNFGPLPPADTSATGPPLEFLGEPRQGSAPRRSLASPPSAVS